MSTKHIPGSPFYEFPTDPMSALKIILDSTFTPFTDNDWACWAGVESDNPELCDLWDNFIIIKDGAVFEFNETYDPDADGDPRIFRVEIRDIT